MSIAARRSIPVPISGASGFSSGTAWRCMFEPISARLASSCSRNGISAVATDQIWVGETSIRSTCFGGTATTSPSRERHRTCGPLSLPVFGSISAFAWAITFSSSWVASRWTISLVTTPSLTTRYGVVTKPCSETSRVGGQRADQADVRALRGLDRAHAAVVGRVHVADLDRRALAGQAAGAERREAAPVREPGERVGLVHELRQLRGAEELLQRRDHGPDVDDRLRRDRVGVLGGEALADDALHPVEADPEGVLDQLADRAQAAVAEVLVLVEVVRRSGRAGR